VNQNQDRSLSKLSAIGVIVFGLALGAILSIVTGVSTSVITLNDDIMGVAVLACIMVLVGIAIVAFDHYEHGLDILTPPKEGE
jgi:hypothetical protein